MKVNNIKALDYQHQGNTLVLAFANTSLEEIKDMDTTLLKVETDEGDMVEAFAGFHLLRVTYEAAEDTFIAVLEKGLDTTSKALAAVTEELKRLDTAQQIVNGPVVAAVCAFAATSTEIPDSTALEMVSLFPTWDDVLQAGKKLPKGRIIVQDGQPYRVEQDGVTPQDHQPPNGEGMLATYRPIDQTHAGTLEDPIPWINGMDCHAGQFFSYNGAIFRVEDGGDMTPCTWPPDTDGMWQWVKIKEV